MKLCANCPEPALYEYATTPYCDKHLPRFLRNADGTLNSVTLLPSDVPVFVAPPFLAVLPDATAPVEVAPTGE